MGGLLSPCWESNSWDKHPTAFKQQLEREERVGRVAGSTSGGGFICGLSPPPLLVTCQKNQYFVWEENTISAPPLQIARGAAGEWPSFLH